MDKPEPRYEAANISINTSKIGLGGCSHTRTTDTVIRHVYRDSENRRCTEFVASFGSTTRDNLQDARICAKALAEHFGETYVE